MIRWKDLPATVRRAITPADAIRELLSCLPLPAHFKLHPEQRISIALATAMREHTLTGRYTGVWFCVQNEAKRHRITAMIQRAMGLVPGVSDFVFVWEGGALFAELKAGKNTQSDNQRYFGLWCDQSNLTYGVFRSVEEVEAKLRTMGAISVA